MALPPCPAPHALPSLLPTQALPSPLPPDLLLIIAEQGEGVMSGPLCEHLSLGVPTSGSQSLEPADSGHPGPQCCLGNPRVSSVHLPCQHLMFLPNSESLVTPGGQLAAPGLPAPGISTRDISPSPQPLSWERTFRYGPPVSCLWVWEEISRVEPSPSSSAPEAWQ